MVTNPLMSGTYVRGYFSESDYSTGIVGTSDCNQYIPFYALFSHNLYVFDSGEKVIEYQLPNPANPSRYVRRYNDVTNQLRTGYLPTVAYFKINGQDVRLDFVRGMLYVNDKILLCVGIEVDYVFSNFSDITNNTIDESKLVLFINNELETNPLYKNVNRNINKLFIDVFKDRKVDVVVTSDIKKWVFKSNYKPPEFSNVVEMQQHLREVPAVLIQ